MGSRYGRNRKRAHREAIAKLNAELVEAKSSERSALAQAISSRSALHDAKALALSDWLNRADEIRHFRDMIAKELGYHLAPELAVHARRLLDASRASPSPFMPSIEAIPDVYRQATVLRGEIPSLRYNVQVM